MRGSGPSCNSENAVDREDIIAVAVRLFTIYLLFALLDQVPALARFVAADDDKRLAILMSIPLFAGLAVCALLWTFPLTIARRLLPAMREPRSERAIDARVATTLGITLLGLWLLANAVLDAIYWLTFAVRAREAGVYPDHITPDQWASIVTTAAEFVLAIVFLLGARGLRHLVERLRHGNRVYADNEPPTG